MKPILHQHMEDKTLTRLQEDIDNGNPFLIDSLVGKTDEEIEKVLENLERALQQHMILHKDTHEIRKDIQSVKSYMIMKTIRETNKKSKDSGEDNVDGVTIA